MIEGFWRGQIDISSCFTRNKNQDDLLPIQVKLTAKVYERDTFQSGTNSYILEPFASGFEIIPLRPAIISNSNNGFPIWVFMHVYKSSADRNTVVNGGEGKKGREEVALPSCSLVWFFIVHSW